MSEVVTLTIAVVGAVTGVGSLVVQAIAARRERARIHLRTDVQTLAGRPPRIVIDVLNDSPRPTTVREIGLYAQPVPIEHQSASGEASPGFAEIDFPFSDGPFFMEANEIRQFAGFPDVFSTTVHVDRPLRVYALDARNRRIWEETAAPYCRLMLGDDPPVLESDGSDIKQAVRPLDRPLYAWPVEPYWKLWKPREQRRWTKEARSVRRQQRANGTIRIRGHVTKFDPGEKPQTGPGAQQEES